MEENLEIDKKSKILLTVLFLVILASIGVTFYRTLVAIDFEVLSR